MSIIFALRARAVVVVFFLFALIFVTLAIYGAFRNYSPIPFWDMWDGYLGFYDKISSGDWFAWWSQHNEHRIVLSRILFWLDIRFFHGLGWFLILANYILLTCIIIIFIKILLEFRSNIPVWVPLFLIVWQVFWIQKNNLTWGFQSQFFLADLLPLITFYYIQKATKSSSLLDKNFIFSLCAGFLAIGSMANGILVLPLLTVYLLIVRMGYKRILITSTLALISIFLYFNDYHSPDQHGSIIHVIKSDPIQLLEYTLIYIGGPFGWIFGNGRETSKVVAICMGIFLLSSSLFFLYQYFKVPIKNRDLLKLSLLFYVVFIVGSAFGTAGGRLIFGLNTALSSRYMTPSLLAWVALFILYLRRGTDRSWVDLRFVWIPFFCLMILMLPQQINAIESNEDALYEREVAALALTLGVKDKAQVANIFPSVNWALDISKGPRERKISIFGIPPLVNDKEKLGQQVDAINIHVQPCLGHLDVLTNIPDESKFYSIYGWLYYPGRENFSRKITIVNQLGQIIGYALLGYKRPDVAKAVNFKAINSGFKGYLLYEKKTSMLYLVNHSKICYLN